MAKLLESFELIGKSINHAFRGFCYAVKSERNLRIELIIAFIVIVAGVVFGLGLVEWILVCGSIFLVVVCELFNTAIEVLCDIINGKHDARIGIAKDVAAASVLLSCVISCIIGILVFGHRILSLLRN
jgi:diacylglycerol kinase